MAASYDVRDTTPRRRLIRTRDVECNSPNHVSVLKEKKESSHNSGTWLYISDVARAYASSVESEGDGLSPSDPERRRLVRGILKTIPRTSPVCSVTDNGQAAHVFTYPIFTGMNQSWLDSPVVRPVNT